MFLAGIDEAGYGPFVGPVVLGWSMFRVPGVDTELWEVTREAAARHPGRKDPRLFVNDSKKVHVGRHRRERLGRTVCAFRRLLETDPSLQGWLAAAPGGDVRWRRKAPWLASGNRPLCPLTTPDRARLDASLLRRSLTKGGCTLAGLGARVVPAIEWNALLQKHGGKGGALFSVALEILQHVLASSRPAPLRVECDRHGGRRRYASILQRGLKPDELKTVAEAPSASLYQLQCSGRDVEIRFSEGADLTHFPVALGSMAAKHTREILMDQWNSWFQKRLPDIAATRGYGVDGKRWLAETEKEWEELGLATEQVRRFK